MITNNMIITVTADNPTQQTLQMWSVIDTYIQVIIGFYPYWLDLQPLVRKPVVSVDNFY